jgi:RNA polymerase sigma-70 factor (ECF subfamily)
LPDAAGGAAASRTTDEALIERLAGANDEDALSQLYDRYQAVMYGLALRITSDPALAQDAVQETFVGVWRNASSYAAGRASVRTWLMAITHNRSIDVVRRRRPAAALPETEAVDEALRAPDVWPEVARAADAQAVRAAMDALPPEQREVIEWAYFGGLTQTEIAQRAGIPLGTVKGRVRLALQAMRRALEEPAP